MDMDFITTLAFYLVPAGAFAGVLAGLLGVGGGIVLVPAFLAAFTALGYDSPALMQLCLGTSLATIIVTSIRSLGRHKRHDAVDSGILKTWAPGIAVGALIGVVVANRLGSDALEAIFGGLTILVGSWLIFGREGFRLGDDMPTGGLRAGLSAGTGLLSTLMGIGGGSIGVPLMTAFGRPVHKAVGTAAGFGLLIAVPSVLGFLVSSIPVDERPPMTVGSVNWPAFAIVIAMTWATTPIGVALAHRLPAKRLRRFFGGFLLLVGARIAWGALAG
ncbi:TSUP family transporter [Alphaproteobacteria bacterium GH1-50]|uniref:Probable membrane transporter protein n=1 Tax=Kangsaoukella pontilimi TaxID=2691042 RepID=A0A7C9MEW4_9RHOB|nr:sulfite exporter TauE/SafE family protein [Kangsaoukella pontilimi]MXQ07356.1 TSUP family transporter [Kangsaoukella pontilimi]